MSLAFDPLSTIRGELANLEPYTPIVPFEVLSEQLGWRPEEIVKLDANENPYGPSPLVGEALAAAPYLHIDPDPESRSLRAALAAYTGVEAEYLLVGHGADELIDLLMRLFVGPGEAIINCPPTFGMYAFDAAVNEARVISIRRRPDFSIDIQAIEALFAGGEPLPKLIYVTSPNNPDGSWLEDEALKRLLHLPLVVALDEAYVEFSQNRSRIRWVKEYANLVVLRTFSKWAGLAGLRVGYGAFPPAIAALLWKIKQPYNVNVAGQVAAEASLADRERLMGNVARLVEQRNRFYTVLAGFEWLQPYPHSQANFILCRVQESRGALALKEWLARQRGILVRYYNSPGLSDHLRFSIGTPAQMVRLEEALRDYELQAQA